MSTLAHATDRKQTEKDRRVPADEWIAAVKAAGLDPVARLAAYELVAARNRRTGYCVKGFRWIAGEMGYGERKVAVRAVGRLAAKKLVEVERRGGNQTAIVRLTLPPREHSDVPGEGHPNTKWMYLARHPRKARTSRTETAARGPRTGEPQQQPAGAREYAGLEHAITTAGGLHETTIQEGQDGR